MFLDVKMTDQANTDLALRRVLGHLASNSFPRLGTRRPSAHASWLLETKETKILLPRAVWGLWDQLDGTTNGGPSW